MLELNTKIEFDNSKTTVEDINTIGYSVLLLKTTKCCPNCGHKKEEVMPTDACQFFMNVIIAKPF